MIKTLKALLIVATGAAACVGKSTDTSNAGLSPSATVALVPAPSATVAPSAAVATTPAPSAPTALGAVAIDHLCTDICERSRLLKCKHPDACKPNCMAMASVTPCSEAFVSFYGCLVTQPPQNWECGEDGVAAIRDGFCDPEQARAAKCMETKMQP